MNASLALFLRDVKLDIRRGGQVIFLPAFFLLIIMLFPLGLGPDQNILQSSAPGLLMIAALLASLLPLEKLYTEDMQDGSFDLALLSGQPLTFYVAAKTLAHWVIAGAPLVVISPLLALMLNIDASAVLIIAVFLPVTLLFVLMGQIAAALSLNARRGSVLMALLVIPLYIPALIFGAGAIGAAQAGLSPAGPVLFLYAMLAIVLPLTPFVTAHLLKAGTQ